jgi:ATP-dependent Lon protease
MPRNMKNTNKKNPLGKKTKEPSKRRSRPDYYDDDDSSVDSHGNLRDLIDYTESDDSSWRESSSGSKSTEKSDPKKWKGRMKGKGKKEKEIMEEEELVEYTPEHTSVTETSEEEEEEVPKRRLRKAAETARRRIRKEVSEESTVMSSEEEEEEEEEEERKTRYKKNAKKSNRRSRRYDEEEEEDEEEDDEELEESSDRSDESEEESDRRSRPSGGLDLFITDLNDALRRPPQPKKYKLKKEPENVRRFVKLVQNDVEPTEEDIDRDIAYFKALTPKAQDRLLTKLHSKVEPSEATVPLKFQIISKDVPADVERVAIAKYNALQNIDPSTTEYYKASQWIHGYTQLPIGTYKNLPVSMDDGNDACQKFICSVRDHMDQAIYGHEEAKLQILQFVSSWIANPSAAGNVVSIHGPPGVGKTTLIKEGVAKALDRPFHFITLGGATDASFLDGHSYTYEGSTWGRIADILMKSKCMNPIIYFDELDKVSETPKGEEINNLLIHLTDGSQNDRFQDKYFTGIDLDLSRCLFIFSHNHHEKVNPILRDRMYNIQVSGFNLKEKLVITDQYLINSALQDVKLFEKVAISKDVIPYIIAHYTGEEKGVRELKRAIQTIVSKLNMLRFYNIEGKVPFYIKGFSLPFTLQKDHVDLLLKNKKPQIDPSISHMYL